MAKCVEHLYRRSETGLSDSLGADSQFSRLAVPESYLVINCTCGEEHRISLNDLPESTSRRMQVEQRCEHARHFIIHSGHPRYRKILIVSEFGD